MFAVSTLIRYWEDKLRADKFLMNISTAVLVEETIKALRRLKEQEAK